MVLFNDQGGGQALPPFLQGRTATPYRSPFQTRPMITPKASIVPGEVKPNIAPANPFGLKPNAPSSTPGLNITPAKPMVGPTVPGGGTLPVPGITPPPGLQVDGGNAPAGKPDTQTLFEFLKKDLENERNKALSGAQSDAAARGVYYGTPLTTSEGDINTSFLRGLGQLQSGMIQNEQQNELAKLGMASNLIGSPGSFSDLASMGQGNPDVYSTIGSLFAGQNPQQSIAGPAITPAQSTTPTSPAKPGPALPFIRGQQPIIKPNNIFGNFTR